MRRFAAFVSAAVLSAALSCAQALAEERPIALKQSEGAESVENNCNSCHSLDYIVMNSRFLSGEKWDAEVSKMIKSYGAAIDEADAKAIAAYLGKNYGSEPQPPQSVPARQP